MSKSKKTGKKFDFVSLILVIFLLAGLSLVLYPSVADYWNSFHQSRAIASYVEQAKNMGVDEYDSMLTDAHSFNTYWNTKSNQWAVSDLERQYYYETLNIGGSGIIGQIDIPSISVNLPIYHGTSDGVLQVAVGHIEGTSLPVGGVGTHSVLSGHRGLPSAKLFTDLDDLIVGDIFYIRVLNEVLTYEVDQILIVLPNDVSSLEIDPEQDLVTLVTCTPYGINSHRLLVRGHRIETTEAAKIVIITGEATMVDKLLVAPFIGVPILVLLFFGVMLAPKRKAKGEGKEK